MKDQYQTEIEIGKRNLNIKHTHWELLDLNHLTFTKPTVLCLSGSGTITNEDANGIAKQAETYLDLMFKTKDGGNVLDNVDILGIKYAQRSGFEDGDIPELAIDKLSTAILSLLVDKNGNRLSVEQAKKNMSRLTFFTYCYGNKILQRIINHLNEKLNKIGYTESEIFSINNASLEVSYAPYDSVYNRIPSIRVISKHDQKLSNPQFNLLKHGGVITNDQAQNLDGISLHQDIPGSGKLYGVARDINPDPEMLPDLPINTATAGSIQIISGGLVNAFYQNNSKAAIDHAVDIVARDKNWNLKPTKIGGLAYQSSNADCVSEMMAWALCKGVENSVQNFKSDKYVANNYWHEMMDDLQSIIDSYDPQKLLNNAQDLGLEK